MSVTQTAKPNRANAVGYIVLNGTSRDPGPLAIMTDTLERFYAVREVVVEAGALEATVDGVDRAARDLQRSCTSVVLVAAGREARGALDAAGRLPSGIDALVLADPLLEQKKPAQALFSGFAALSSAGLALAGLARRGRAEHVMSSVAQPVLVIATSTGTGGRSRSVQRLQSGIAGLVELAVIGHEDGEPDACEAVARTESFAERMSLRALKTRRGGTRTMAAAKNGLASGALAVA